MFFMLSASFQTLHHFCSRSHALRGSPFWRGTLVLHWKRSVRCTGHAVPRVALTVSPIRAV